MKILPAGLAFLLISVFSQGQTAFSLSTSTVTVEKPADSFVAYFYAEIFNNTGADLEMRWVKLPPGSHDPTPPSAWEFTFQDPENFYDPAIDSADFTLSATPQTTDKLILQAYPNLMAGHGIFKYRIFPVDDPDDSAILTFDYTFTKVVSATFENVDNQAVSLFPNPAGREVFVKNDSPEKWEVTLADVSGKVIGVFPLAPWSVKKLTVSSPGVYFLKGASGGQYWSEIWLAN